MPQLKVNTSIDISGTVTEKAGKKDVPIKPVIKLRRQTSGLVKLYVVSGTCIAALGISLLLLSKFTCKNAKQITPPKPKECMEIPKSDKEIPFNPKTGKDDKTITIITNLHKATRSDPKNSSELDGKDIDGTSESNNDTSTESYFQAWQNSLRVVFKEPYDFISFETESDEDIEEAPCGSVITIVSIILIIFSLFTLNVSFFALLWLYWYKDEGISVVLTA